MGVGGGTGGADARDVSGNQPWHTAVHVAAEKGDLAVARTLLELGADPYIFDKHYQSTPSAGPATSTNPQWPSCSNR
jgi:hypothetical protein